MKSVKQLIAALSTFASIVSLVSCDSREDWFAKEGEGATFIIRTSKSAWWEDEEKYEFKNDTVYSDNYRVVEYNLKINRVECEYNSSSIPRFKCFSENLNLDIEGFGQKVSRNSGKENITTVYTRPDLNIQSKDGNDCLYFTYFWEDMQTSSDTSAHVLNTADVIMELDDVFRNKLYCHVKINCLGNIAPISVMEVKDVDGNPMEKILNLGNSYDKDGSVEKYEYCIDGEIVQYSRPTYECNPEGISSGKGAYGGTYITATEKSEVRHAFQTKGDHLVCYRCMDNLGLWGVWNYVIVTIK